MNQKLGFGKCHMSCTVILLHTYCLISVEFLTRVSANLFEAAQTRMRVEDVDFIVVIIQGLVDERVSAD